MTAVLMIPVLWAAVTQSARQPRLTHQQCEGLWEDPSRLACYDDASRQTSLRSAKDVRRMSFGELLGAQRSDQVRDTSTTPK
jgi:hypothetical protein